MPNHFVPPVNKAEKDEEAKQAAEKKKNKQANDFSSWGIFFGVLLFVVLTILWQLAFRDLPRFFSPYYEICFNSGPAIVQQYCDMRGYEIVKILLHLSFFLPLLLVLVCVFYANAGKKMRSHSLIIFRAYLFSVLITALHLFIEFALYLFQYYREIGNYVVLSCVALAFIALIIYLQKRFNRPKEN